jgi:hypothetical protein
MQVTIDLPPILQSELSAQANTLNLSIEAYILQLLETENLVFQVLKDDLKSNPSTDPDDTPIEEIAASLRQGWHDAMNGKTIPISQLWDGMDVD